MITINDNRAHRGIRRLVAMVLAGSLTPKEALWFVHQHRVTRNWTPEACLLGIAAVQSTPAYRAQNRVWRNK